MTPPRSLGMWKTVGFLQCLFAIFYQDMPARNAAKKRGTTGASGAGRPKRNCRAQKMTPEADAAASSARAREASGNKPSSYKGSTTQLAIDYTTEESTVDGSDDEVVVVTNKAGGDAESIISEANDDPKEENTSGLATVNTNIEEIAGEVRNAKSMMEWMRPPPAPKPQDLPQGNISASTTRVNAPVAAPFLNRTMRDMVAEVTASQESQGNGTSVVDKEATERHDKGDIEEVLGELTNKGKWYLETKYWRLFKSENESLWHLVLPKLREACLTKLHLHDPEVVQLFDTKVVYQLKHHHLKLVLRNKRRTCSSAMKRHALGERLRGSCAV